MKLSNASPPFLHTDVTVMSMLGDRIFALCALLVIPTVRYGPRPLVMAGLSVFVCFMCELLTGLMRKEGAPVTEWSFAVTGLVITMLMPANAPLWLPCAACLFAELAAKAPFGGFGRTPFNPAAAGAAFATLCWPKQMFSYVDPAEPQCLPVWGGCSVHTAQSAAAYLKSGLKPDILPFDMLWGDMAGPLGTGAALVIGACALLLFVRRAAHAETTLCFLAAAAVLAALFPRIACSPLTSVKYELLSGSLFFCSVFLMDPVSSLHTAAGRCIYGAAAGGLLMAFRHFGAYEQGAVFAVLIANALSPLISSAVGRARGWEGSVYG